MNIWRQMLAGYRAQRQFFAQGRYENARENLITMQIAGSVGSVVTGIFFIIAPIIIPSWSITVEYYFIIPILALTFLFSFFYSRQPEPNPLVVEVACALFYALTLADLIALSVFPYPNTPQIFVSLCFMFMPALIIQRPLVQLSLMLTGEVVFVWLASVYKTTFSLENDIFNTIAAFFFSLIIMGTTNRLRCRNYAARLKLEKLSQTDALTGLLNKKAFEECGATYINSQELANGHALLVLDVDDFKQVNDSYGHPFGDALLTAVGQVLRESFRQTDLVGRIGGDEFAVLMRDFVDQSRLEKKCAELNRRFAAITIDGVAVNAVCSMGVAMLRDQQTTYGELFRLADSALYQVKRSGKGSVAISGPKPARGAGA